MKNLFNKIMIFMLFGLVPTFSFAQLQGPAANVSLPVLATTSSDILTLMQTVLNWLFFVLVFMAILMILLIAFNFVSKGGTTKGASEVPKLWGAFYNILIGIALALAAKGVVYLVCSLFVGGYCNFF